jgi:hypothetical protein
MTSKLKLVIAGLMLFAFLVASEVALADVVFVGFDKKAKLTNGGTVAIVTGAVTCTGGDTATVGANIFQNKAQVNIVGVGFQEGFTCISGVPIPVSVASPTWQTRKQIRSQQMRLRRRASGYRRTKGSSGSRI